MILLLNGASSSGKTTIALGLLEALSGPAIHLSLDAFSVLLAARFQTPSWPLFEPLARGLHRTALAWDEIGFTVVVDTVLERESLFVDCVKLFCERRAYFVGVRCPLPELMRRARARTDRDQRWTEYQVGRVHGHSAYDIELDTGALTPSGCVMALLRHLDQNPRPGALRQARARLGL